MGYDVVRIRIYRRRDAHFKASEDVYSLLHLINIHIQTPPVETGGASVCAHFGIDDLLFCRDRLFDTPANLDHPFRRRVTKTIASDEKAAFHWRGFFAVGCRRALCPQQVGIR